MSHRQQVVALAFAFAILGGTPAIAAEPDDDIGAVADSSRFLPRGVHFLLEVGATGMRSPTSVSDRYTQGVTFSGALATAGSRARLTGRLEYFDLPNGEQGYTGYYQADSGQVTAHPLGGNSAFHGGHSSQVMGLFSLRPLGPFWLEAGIGYGYWWSGYPDIQFIDGSTGQYIDIPGQSGWAPVFSWGLTFEFTPAKGQNLHASVRWTRLDRGDQALDFLPIVIGYRFD